MKDNLSRLRRVGRNWALPIVVLNLLFVSVIPGSASADNGDFTIQVSPSPLSVTLTPGKTQTAELTVRNLSSHAETLVPRLNDFTIGQDSKNISLKDTPPAGLGDWVSFNQTSLTIPAGGTGRLDITYRTPQDVGFSYATAITLNRADDSGSTPQGAKYKASVAVFNLLTINRPDAKRVLGVASFKANRSSYEFLPAQFDLQIKNSGNVIAQPSGTIFIQRSFDSNKPLAIIPINPTGSYVLPGTTRGFQSSWDKGFPVYITENGKKDLSWNWKHLSDLRFGRYVAKVVLIYNDGHGDVPVVASYSFWVIPWRIIIFFLVLAVILVMGVISWGKLIAHGTGKLRKKYAARKH